MTADRTTATRRAEHLLDDIHNGIGDPKDRSSGMSVPDTPTWHVLDEAIRGFLFEKHLPFDTADEWTTEIVTLVAEHLAPDECPHPTADVATLGEAEPRPIPACACDQEPYQ